MRTTNIDYNETLNSGKYLFKFCTFNVNTLQILINNTLYFAAPDLLNDPLDCRIKDNIKIIKPENYSTKTINTLKNYRPYLNELVKSKLRDITPTLGNIGSIKEQLNTYFSFDQNEFYGICCFSIDYQHNLLWSHYANEARGLVLAFNKEKLFESFRENLKGKPYDMIPRNISYKSRLNNLEVQLYKDGRILYKPKHFFSKTLYWKHEKEYRLVISQKQISKFILEPVVMNRFVSFKKECLEYIIAGERIKPEHRDILYNLFGGEKVLQHSFD